MEENSYLKNLGSIWLDFRYGFGIGMKSVKSIPDICLNCFLNWNPYLRGWWTPSSMGFWFPTPSLVSFWYQESVIQITDIKNQVSFPYHSDIILIPFHSFLLNQTLPYSSWQNTATYAQYVYRTLCLIETSVLSRASD